MRPSYVNYEQHKDIFKGLREWSQDTSSKCIKAKYKFQVYQGKILLYLHTHKINKQCGLSYFHINTTVVSGKINKLITSYKGFEVITNI